MSTANKKKKEKPKTKLNNVKHVRRENKANTLKNTLR
jgi:hypothetical protein